MKRGPSGSTHLETDLTAIDILIIPDDATVARAREVNARLRESVTDGFALDAGHQPHITMLQRYVRTADLVHAYDAVEKTVAGTDIDSLSFETVAIRHVAWGVPGQGLAVFAVETSPQALAFQVALLAAIDPFAGSGGTAAAFVTDADEPDIGQSTIDWVERFVPEQIGPERYFAHLTVGFATLDDLKVIEAEPFDAFAVHPASIAVFHLGNNGSARIELRSWSLGT